MRTLGSVVVALVVALAGCEGVGVEDTFGTHQGNEDRWSDECWVLASRSASHWSLLGGPTVLDAVKAPDQHPLVVFNSGGRNNPDFQAKSWASFSRVGELLLAVEHPMSGNTQDVTTGLANHGDNGLSAGLTRVRHGIDIDRGDQQIVNHPTFDPLGEFLALLSADTVLSAPARSALFLVRQNTLGPDVEREAIQIELPEELGAPTNVRWSPDGQSMLLLTEEQSEDRFKSLVRLDLTREVISAYTGSTQLRVEDAVDGGPAFEVTRLQLGFLQEHLDSIVDFDFGPTREDIVVLNRQPGTGLQVLEIRLANTGVDITRRLRIGPNDAERVFWGNSDAILVTAGPQDRITWTIPLLEDAGAIDAADSAYRLSEVRVLDSYCRSE